MAAPVTMRAVVDDGKKLWRCAVTCELVPPANAQPQLLLTLVSPNLTFIVLPSNPPFQLHHIASWSAFQRFIHDDGQTPADAAEPVRPAATAALGRAI
jgi:hypothetical protein